MTTVAEIMTRDVVQVSAALTLREVIEVLAREHIGGAVVVDADRVMGVVSAADLFALLADVPGVPAERQQSADPGEPDEPVPYLEGEEEAVSFFTDMWDDAGAQSTTRMDRPEGPEWDFLAEHTVAEAMNRRVFHVGPDATVADAARRMDQLKTHRLLVMKGKRLLGIVTTSDVNRAVARSRAS